MIELIINAPHGQNWGQRLVVMMSNLIGWFLWGYFLFPLLALLVCWFLDFGQCSQWMSMSGGYLNLQETLSNYLETVVVLVCAWVAWVGYNLTNIRSRPMIPPQSPVSRSDLCLTFNVTMNILKECQESRFVLVHFDQQGHIIGLEKA